MNHDNTLTTLDKAARTARRQPLPAPARALEIRTESAVTPTLAAAVIGVSERTYSRWENGHRGASFAKAVANDRAARLFAHLATTVNAE